MASVEAAINLVVRGSGAVNRLIQDINRLEGLVESLSRSPIDISFGNADREIQRLGRAVRGTDGEIQALQNSLNPLRQAYERTAQGAARFERANNVFNRSLEVSRRAVSLYQANIESLNRTAYGQPERSAAISTLNTAFREGLVTQRDYARLMLRTRQEFANLYAAEAALERAQTRQNSLIREAAQNTGSLVRARSAMAAQAQEIARGEQRIEMVRGRMATQQNLLEGAEGFRNQIDFLNRLASSYTSVEAAAARASGNLENIPRDMSRGGVRQEISVFDDLANSVNYTSDAFNRFTIASQAANLTLGQIQRQRLRVLTEAFSPSFAAGAQPLDSPRRGEGAVDISNTRAAVNRLLLESQPSERAGATVQRGLVRSEAGLTLMIDQLQQLRALIPFVDADYGRLTERITELNEELNRGTGRPDPAQRRINAELSRQADIENRINEANLTIGQQEVVRNRLAEARVALEERGVEAAREQTSGLTRQINAMQSINRAQERRNSAVEDELSLLEGRIGRIQRSDLPDDVKTILTNRANEAIDLLIPQDPDRSADGLLGGADLEGARRVRKELERDRIAAEKDYRSTLSVNEARSNQIGKILKLEQELNKIRLSGRDTAAQDVELGRIKDALTSNTVQLNKQLISDTSIALDRVADYVTQQRDGIRVTNEQIKNTEKQNKANQDLITKGNVLKAIQHDYNKLKAKGISISEIEAELSDTIAKIDNGQYEVNEKSIAQLNTLIGKYASFVALKRRDLDENRLGPATRLGGGEQLIEQQKYEREMRARGKADESLRKREEKLGRALGLDLFIKSLGELESAYAEMNDTSKKDLARWDEKLKLADRFKDIQNKINTAALAEFEKQDYLLDLEKAKNAAGQDRLVLARAITDEIDDQIKLETSLRSRSQGAIWGMGPKQADIDTINGPATSVKGRKQAGSQERSAQLILENLASLEKQGVDVSERRASIQSVITGLRNKDLQLSDKILDKNNSELENAEHFLRVENKRLYNARLQDRIASIQGKAAEDLITKGNALKAIQAQLNTLRRNGIFFSEEEEKLLFKRKGELQSLVDQINSGQYEANEQSIRSLDTLIKKYGSFVALKEEDARNARLWQQKGGPALPAVNQVVGPTSAINEPEKFEDLIQRAKVQQQALLGLQVKGIDVTQQQSELQQVINELESRTADLRGKGANLSEKLRESVRRELDLGDDKIRLMNGQKTLSSQMLGLEDSFIEKRNKLNKLLSTYNQLKKKGVSFQGEDVELEALVNSISGVSSASATKDFVDDLGRKFKVFQSAQSRSVQEAVAAGTFTGTTQTPEKLEKERNRQLREAYGLRKTLDDLEKKGIVSDLTRIDLLQQINTLEQRRGQIAADNLIAVQAELETTSRVLDVTRTEIARLKSDIEETSKATGFGKSFQDFQEALKGSRTFFGTESPAEAIDKIVREFNKGDLTTATRDGEGAAAAAAENVVDTYASRIRAGIPAAAKAMMDLGKAGIAAIKKALGIASPSRVMLEIAINQVDTYVNYLRAAIPQIEATAKAVAEAGTPSAVKFPVVSLSDADPDFAIDAGKALNRMFVPGSFNFSDRFAKIIKEKGQFPDLAAVFDFNKLELPNEAKGLKDIYKNDEVRKVAQAYIDFFDIPSDLTPEFERASASAQVAEQEAVQLNTAVIELANGLENITRLIQSAATLPTSSVAPQDPFDAAMRKAAEIDRRNAEEAQRLAAIRSPFEASTQRAAQLDEERRRAATAQAFAPSAAQAAADANAAAAATSQAIQDPIVDAAPEGERQVRNAIQRLFDKISSILGGLAGGGGAGLPPRPPVGPGGPAGPGGGDDGPGGFGARLGAAEAEGVEALLGLQELKKPSKATTKQLEILSAVLKDVYVNLDPTAENAKKLNAELRRATASLDDIVASRAPDADPLVRLTRSPRLAQGISEGLIGGAFPLLFGQGAGAAVGGGLGGFAGGFMGGALGFGLSLIGTAVGTAVDTFVNNMKELGKSLKDPTAALTAMETAGLRVTPQLQDTVERLQNLGLAAAAQAVVFSELEAQLGKDGAAQIRALTEEQKKLDEQMQKLNGTMISALLPAVTGTVSVINDLASAIKSLGEVQLPDWLKSGARRVTGFAAEAGLNAASFTTPGLGPARLFLRQAGDRGKKAAEEASRTPVELTPELRRQQELALPKATLEALNVQLDNGAKQFTDQVKAAAREQQDLDLQRRDLIESYERSIGDLRLTIERQVTQERLANAGRENEILAAQGEVRLQQLRNANAELTRSLSGNEFGQQLADAVSQFTEQQLSTENEIANRRRNLELELETKRIQTEQYRADIAKQIEQLNLSTAKQVASIQLSVARKNEDYDRKRFQLEKQIAVMNLNVSRIETEQKIAGLDLQVQAVTDPALRQSVFNTIDKYRDIIKQRDSQIQKINAAQPPAPISFNVPALGASVSTSGIDKVVAKGAQLARQLESIRTQLNTLVSEGNFNEFNDRLKNLADQGVQALTNEYEDLLAAMSADPTAAADKRIVDAMKAVTEGRGIRRSPLREELIQLVGLYGDLAKQNIELARTYEFLTSRLSSQLDQIEELKEQFNTLTVGNTEYEKTLIALTQRGVNPASEGFSKLIENAKEIDRLNQKIEVVNAFRTAATELTGSMRSLVEQFFELGSASEAVKRVSDELGKKAFGFILDIAFKPVEDAMQKTMLDLANKLGFDIRPESLKQLQEVTTIRQNVEIIANSMAPLVEKLKSLQPILPGLTSGSASGGNLLTPGLPFSAQTSVNSQNLINQINSEIGPRLFAKIDADIQGYYDKIISMHALNPPTAERRIADVDKLIQTRTNLLDGLAGAFSDLIIGRVDAGTPGAPELVDELNRKINEMRLKYEKKAEDILRGEAVAPVGPQSSLPLSMMNGIGGPDLRTAYPIPDSAGVPVINYTPSPSIPSNPALNKAEQDAVNNIRPLAKEIQVMGTAAAQARDPLMEVVNQFPPFGKAAADVAATTNQSSNKIAGIVPQWGKNLGAVVTGLGLASSAVVSIVGGIGSIKKGGAGNVLSGIGSILTTIGGIGMSAAGFMKPAAGNSMLGVKTGFLANANGNVFDDGKLMRFANGGVLQSPTLFNFEDAGVTKTGQAGEAGVEAVMPLKRTKDGRLGVEADLSIPFENDGQFEAEDDESGEGAGTPQSPMVPFLRAGGRTGAMTATQMLQAAAEAGLSVPFMRDSTVAAPDLASLDSPIRFETFQVGQLDVVTREEAEEIGRRAEARGTIKGAALAQKKMQNSPATRRKSGLPI